MIRSVRAGIIGKSRASKALDLIDSVYPGAKRNVVKAKIGKWQHCPLPSDHPACLAAKVIRAGLVVNFSPSLSFHYLILGPIRFLSRASN